MSTGTLVAPRTIDEAAACVREAARAGAVVLPSGSGSKPAWARAPVRTDVALSTVALTGIVAHEPGDGVLTALAGTPWIDVVRAAAAHGHHISPWIPGADRATVGGVVAAAQSGADRLCHGPLRYHVLGLAVVDGEGRVVRSGGRLVKNVTGFDVHRLHVGAHGTLGIVVEASFRLHAAPAMRAAATAAHATRAEALEAARGVIARARLAWSVRVAGPARAGDPWTVGVLAGGLPEAVDAEVRDLCAVAPSLAWTTDGARAWDAAREHDLEDGAWPTLHATCAHAALDRVLAALDRALATRRLDARVTIEPGLPAFDARIGALDADSATEIVRALDGAGARVHWRGLDAGLRSRVDPWGGAVPAGLALMRRVKQALDPRGTFASGRLAGEL